MSAAPHFSATWPAVSRILDHCSSLDRVLVDDRATAWSRLEGELGGDLARRLVGALSGSDRRAPARFSA
jgi:hypothetical protein